MPFISQVRVLQPTFSHRDDGADGEQLGGNQAEGIIAQLHGKHYTSAYRGGVFAATVFNKTIPVFDNATQSMILWNPAGSSVNAVLMRFTAAHTSGSNDFRAIGLAKINAGSSVSDGSSIPSFSDDTSISNLLLNRGNKNRVRVSSTATISGVADFFYTMWQEAGLGATNAAIPTATTHDFDGVVIVTPGVAVWSGGSAASLALYNQTWVWKEVPV